MANHTAKRYVDRITHLKITWENNGTKFLNVRWEIS